MVTTRRAIKAGNEQGVRDIEFIPLTQIVGLQIVDVSRDQNRLRNGVLALLVGALCAWAVWQIFGVVLFTIAGGGIPTLFGIFLLSGYLFPDDGESALILHGAGRSIRLPLITTRAREDIHSSIGHIYQLLDSPQKGNEATGASPFSNPQTASTNYWHLRDARSWPPIIR